MENSKSCSRSSCWTMIIAIIALSISLLCLGVIIGQCMNNCSTKKTNCKTKSYKNYTKSDSYSGSTCNYEKKEKKCSKKWDDENESIEK